MVSIRNAVLILLVSLAALATPGAVQADGRTETVREERVSHVWGVGGPGLEICRILTADTAQVPQRLDVAALCGGEAANLLDAGAVYVFYMGEYRRMEDVTVALPDIQIYLDISGDTATVSALDPLVGAEIVRLEGTLGNAPFVCDRGARGYQAGAELRCDLPLYSRPAVMTYWAVSSSGDQTVTHTAYIGEWKITADRTYTGWSPADRVPLRWGMVPPSSVPRWLEDGTGVSLETALDLYYLSGRLITENPEIAASCAGNGLERGYATPCGVKTASHLAAVKQNAYNGTIKAASASSGAPPRVIKGIISAESQFYPGALGIAGETGLYQLTREGADTLLRWSGPAYLEYCRLYFQDCVDLGYDNRAGWEKSLLVSSVLADRDNIGTLGETLVANAYQVDQLLENVLRIENAGAALDYAALWKMTIANYHAGARVTAAALHQLKQLQQPLTWDNYAAALDRVYPPALVYVDRVTSLFSDPGETTDFLPAPASLPQ